ncbi:MAG: type II toxin-antitoxin system prevent-host-death family antitoxin [Deltaproteobacteria bacterium]|nr:type II toxin-antitoxin system prevent-host-death family antitoxin [Deltaproteobacteria bacterium]
MRKQDEVPVRDLRNHTTRVLRRVERGERVRVTINGRPVAEIRPLARRREVVPWDELSRALEVCRADAGLLDDLRMAVPDTSDDVR